MSSDGNMRKPGIYFSANINIDILVGKLENEPNVEFGPERLWTEDLQSQLAAAASSESRMQGV